MELFCENSSRLLVVSVSVISFEILLLQIASASCTLEERPSESKECSGLFSTFMTKKFEKQPSKSK